MTILQIAHNSFAFNRESRHPGLKIYLQSNEINDRLRIATELSDPYYLTDKKMLQLSIQKKVCFD